MGRDADGDIKNHIVTAKTKTEEKQLADGPKSPKKRNSVKYHFYFAEKNYNKKSLEGKFQNKIQTAVSGTESTKKTHTGKIVNQSLFRDHYFRPKERAEKNRH